MSGPLRTLIYCLKRDRRPLVFVPLIAKIADIVMIGSDIIENAAPTEKKRPMAAEKASEIMSPAPDMARPL